MLHTIFAAHLLHDEFGIESDGEPQETTLFCALEADAECGPLGDIVRCNAEIAAHLIEDLTVVINEDRAACGGTGVPAGTAVCKKGCLGRQGIEQSGHPEGILSPMRNVIVRGAATALVLTAMLFAPLTALAANTFYGLVTHISTNNIKVEDPKTKQTLSFEILPKFDQIFSANGKTTYQMKDIKNGHYVGVVYDQKALGVRHADKIYILNNANQRVGSQ